MDLDKGPMIAQVGFYIRSGMALKEIIAVGQRFEAKALVKTIKLYLTKRLGVCWGWSRKCDASRTQNSTPRLIAQGQTELVGNSLEGCGLYLFQALTFEFSTSFA